MLLYRFCHWLNDTRLATAIRESIWIFPILNTVHVLAITLLVGTIVLLDLRLLGLLLRKVPVPELAEQILPLTWIGFALMFSSGVLLFASEAANSYANPAFRVKMILLCLVGLNPLIFHCTIYRSVGRWGQSAKTPLRAKIAAVSSIVLWAAIIMAGRAYAYF